MTFRIVYARELEMYMQKEHALVVDLRDTKDFEAGHWPGARNLPEAQAERWGKLLPRKRLVIFYCSHGGSSMQIARDFGRKGYWTATVVGGYPAIKKYLQGT